MNTALIALASLLVAATPAQAITFGEFTAALKSADEQAISKAALEVGKTGSPEFMVRAARALTPNDAAASPLAKEKALALLGTAAGMTPRNRDQATWIGRAQFEVGKYYYDDVADKKSKALALEYWERASLNGNPKAPVRLAKAIGKRDPEKAEAYLRLSIARGNDGARATLEKLFESLQPEEEGAPQ